MSATNNIRLTLEFDISQGKKGFDNFLQYGKNVKQQLNGLFVSPTEFKGMEVIGKDAITSGAGVDELTKKVHQLTAQMEALRNKGAGVTGTGPGSLQKFTQLTGNSRMAVSAFNYTLQDSGMFFVNFRMGMMSISNNVPMLLQGLMGMKREAAEGNKAFKTYLKESFSGPNAFLPVMSMVSVAMIGLPIIFDMINASAKRAAEEGIAKLTKELELLSNAQLLERMDSIRQTIANMALDISKIQMNWGALGAIYNMMGNNTTLEGFIKRLSLLTDENGLREKLNKTILGRLELEKKEIEAQKKTVALTDTETLLDLNNKLADVNDRIRIANMSSAELEKEKNSHLNNQLKTIKEIYAIKKMSEADTGAYYKRLQQENELAKLQIENIDDKEQREIKLSLLQYKLDADRIKKEVSDKQLEYQILGELYLKHLKDLAGIKEKYHAKNKQSDPDTENKKDDIEEEFTLYKAMYESAADVLRSETVDAWEHIFGEANSLAEKFGQKLLQIFLDEALRAAARDLFSGAGGSGGRAGGWLGTLLSAGIGFVTGGPVGAAVAVGASAASGLNKPAIDSSVTNTTDLTNYAVTPSATEVRTVVLQTDMSVVRDEIRSWAKSLEFKARGKDMYAVYNNEDDFRTGYTK